VSSVQSSVNEPQDAASPNAQPSTRNGQRATDNERPSTLDPRPSANDSPSTIDHSHELVAPRSRRDEFWPCATSLSTCTRARSSASSGRNGAGKSTLLKILSQITEPTTGEVHIRGRVASLLEVGTGFHPELTGRENIFMNGAILGMSQAEIRRKFDEIVAFAEVERFLDTPVKRYSSGMYVRLALPWPRIWSRRSFS